MDKPLAVYTDHTCNLYRALAIFDADYSVIDSFLLEDFSQYLEGNRIFTRNEHDAVRKAYERRSHPRPNQPRDIQEKIQDVENSRLDIIRTFGQCLIGKGADVLRKAASDFMRLKYTDRFPFNGTDVRAFRNHGYRTVMFSGCPAAVTEPFVDDLDFGEGNVYSSDFELDQSGCFTGVANPIVEGERKLDLIRKAAKEQESKLALSTLVLESITQAPVSRAVGTVYVVTEDYMFDQLMGHGWIFCEHGDSLLSKVLETLPRVKLRYDDRSKIEGIVAAALPDLTKNK